MAASVASSTIVTNTLAHKLNGAVSYNALGASGEGKLRIAAGSMEIATTSIDEIGDKVMLFPVRGNERIVSLVILSDDLDSNGAPALAYDIGLYKDVTPAGTAATTVDADAYASAVTTSQAGSITNIVDHAFEARNIDKMGQTVAADGGESEHSDLRYVGINVTAAAATAAAGTLSWRAIIISV